MENHNLLGENQGKVNELCCIKAEIFNSCLAVMHYFRGLTDIAV